MPLDDEDSQFLWGTFLAESQKDQNRWYEWPHEKYYVRLNEKTFYFFLFEIVNFVWYCIVTDEILDVVDEDQDSD
jgi:hypothetical protein